MSRNPNQHLSLVLLIFLALFIFVKHSFAQDQFERYIDEQNGFSISYLSNMHVVKSQYDDGGTHFIDTRNNPPAIAVNVNKVQTKQPVSELASDTEKYIQNQSGIADFTITNKNSIRVSGMKGINKTLQYTLDNNQLTVKTVYLGDGNNVIMMSMTGTEKSIDEYSSIFDAMLESIMIL